VRKEKQMRTEEFVWKVNFEKESKSVILKVKREQRNSGERVEKM
jgi:hypothetical protein